MRRSAVQVYVGRRLGEERAALDYTQAEFAKIIGCSQPQYGRYENGTRGISASELQELATTLQMPIESFFPAPDRGKIDNSEKELLEAWRSRKLGVVLRLVTERFG